MSVKCQYSNKFMPLAMSWASDVANGIKTEDDILQLVEENFDGDPTEVFRTIMGHYPVDRTKIEGETPILVETKQNSNEFDRDNDTLKTHYRGHITEYNSMIRQFKNEIMSRVIFDRNKSTNPWIDPTAKDLEHGGNILNNNIVKYKLGLIDNINKYLNKPYYANHNDYHITNNIPYDNGRIVHLDEEIKQALSDFEKGVTVTSGSEYQDALNSYVILSKFNELLTANTPFVSVRPEYKNSTHQDIDMYEYLGPNVQHYTGWSQTQDVSIDDQTSDLLKLLLDYFPEVGENEIEIPNSSIGTAGFNSAMTSLKTAMFYDPELRNMFEDELYKGNDMQLNKVISQYIDYINQNRIDSSYKTFLINKLRGINKYIFNNSVDPAIKSMFIAQFNKTVPVKYRSYQYDFYNGGIGGRNLREQLINVQSFNLQDSIKSAVKVFTDDPEYFQKILDKYNIEIDVPNRIISFLGGKYIIEFDGTDTGKGVKYSFTKTGNLDPKELRDIASDLISFMIPDDFEKIGFDINPAMIETSWNESNAFTPVLGLTLMAAYNKGNTFSFKKDKYDLVDIYPYFMELQPIARIMSVIYGADTVNVIKDSKGNNLPLYQLISLVYNWPNIIHDIEYDRRRYKAQTGLDLDNIYANNILFRNKHIVGPPVTRSDVSIRDRSKTASELTIPEVMRLSIFYDFYNELKNDTGHIYLQNTTFSDKARHYLQDYNINTIIHGPTINGKNEYRLVELIKPALRNGNTKSLFQLYFKLENDKINRAADNLLTTYNHVFGISLNTLDELDAWLSDKSEKYIQAGFKARNIPLTPQFHYTTVNNGKKSRLGVNETMLAAYRRFGDSKNDKEARRFIDMQRRRFVYGLLKDGFKLNIYNDPSLQEFGTDYSTWVDRNSGNISIARLTHNGQHESIGVDYEKILDPTYDIELNPVFETYLMTDGLLSTQFNSLLTGEVWAHPNKNKEGLTDDLQYTDDYFTFSEANRLIAQNKRATIYGATTHPFLQNLKNGVSERIKVAAIKDIKGAVYTITGEQDEIDSMDGSGFSSIYEAIFENNSLLDAKVALDKKTIMHTMNAVTGMQQQLKWAVYALTNERRRNSWGSDVRAENLHKKMHNFKLNRDDINFNKYLKSIPEDLFFKDWKTSKYYKIVELSDVYLNDNPDGSTSPFVNRTIIETDSKGNVLPEAQIQTQQITWNDTIYDIDQLFGGAWAMTKNTNTGDLIYSDTNNYLVSNIIAEEELKDKFIAYAVNTSAIKVGATNINSVNSWYDDTPFDYMDFSTKFGGVQMNADHELDYAEVTEMSQMISSFIQNGWTKNIALQAYREIGEVAADSIKDFKQKIAENDREAVYKLLGEALVKAFNTGDKDTLGLAQAFVQEAEKGLKNANLKYTIPFSAPTIRGAFIATVTSTLNKRGIRRKYEGLAGVLTPSNDMIQYFQWNGNTYMFEEFARMINDHYKNKKFYNTDGQEITAIEYMLTVPDVNNNDAIQPISKNDIEFEDTVIAVIDGIQQTFKVNNYNTYEFLKHSPKVSQVWRWSFKPRNLKGQETYFTITGINGKDVRFNLYDLDAVRASQIVVQAIKNKIKTLTQEELDFISRVIPLTNPDGSAKDLNKMQFDIKRAAQRILNRIQTQKTISMQQAFEGYVNPATEFQINNIESHGAQIVVGRRYARQFGLRQGDSLAAIKRDPLWFNKRMRDEYTMPTLSRQDICDVVLFRQDGKRLLVKFASNDDFAALVDSSITYENDNFRTVDNIIFYNGQELGNSDGKKTYKYHDANSNEDYDLIVLNNPNNLNELLNTGMFDIHRYNYTESNYRNLLEIQFGEQENIDLKITDKNNKSKWKTFDLEDPDLIYALIDNEQRQFQNRIANAAKNKYDAFIKSLQFVGARIPTQSMQSFAALEVVGFSDSETNSIYVPKMITYLEGSDFDIDKQYVMGFSITDNGKLQTMSNLQNEDGITIDMVNALPKPNGIEYSESNDANIVISLQELQQVTKALREDLIPNIGGIQRSLEPLIRILNSGESTIKFQPFISNDLTTINNYNRAKRKFMRMLNKHSLTKLNNYNIEQALKNQVVQRALDITLDPRNQINLQIPIVMTQIQDAAKKSSMGRDEKYLSSFNPYTKYMMQYQNMVGKQVIGISAVSMKVKFAIETYMDRMIDEMQSFLETGDTQSALILLDQLTIKHPLTGDITVMANINFNDAINYLINNSIETIPAEILQVPSQLQRYYRDGNFYIRECLNDLQDISDHTDAAETLSELISSATDNAKELTLAKINATSKFADIYTYLISIGTPFTEITKIMMSPIFNQVAKIADSNIFDSNTWGFNLKDALKFYVNQQPLGFVDSQVLLHVLSPAFFNNLNLSKDERDIVNKILSKISSSPARNLVGKAMAVTEDNGDINILTDILKRHLENISTKHITDNEDWDEQPDEYYEEDDFYDFGEYDTSDDELSGTRVNRDFNQNVLKPRELRSIITFLEYCRDRNNQIEKLRRTQDLNAKSVNDQLQDLITLTNNILPAMEEQRIMGSILGINQGMRTNAYDKYKYIQNIENFINKRITRYNRDNGSKFERFNLMRFLSDDTYRDEQIKNYDSLKSTYNILDAITRVPHFNAMFNILYVDNWIIKNFSVITNLTDRLANEILNQKDSKLTQKEYKIVQNYANNILILNWLLGSNFQFKVPKGQSRFTGYGDNTLKDLNRDETIPLNTVESLATFKRVMDTYIIPMLKNPSLFPESTTSTINTSRYSNNAFIKALSRTVIGDSKSGRTKTFWRIGQINMMQIDASQKTQLEYEKILSDFNKIKDDKFNGWRIADLFYLYNLITNKDNFGRSSMTRLFEDLVSSGDRTLIVNNFYDYVSKLDLAEDKDQLIYNLDDLRLALANTKNSQERFGSKRIGTVVSVDNQSSQDYNLLDPSYFTFDMPYLRGQSITRLRSTVTPIKQVNHYFDIHLDDNEAVNAIAENFNKKTHGLMHVVTKDEINDLVPGNLAALNSNGFIHNGEAYVNISKATISAPLHEFAHMILAQLRFNNPDEYYKLLNSTLDYPNIDDIVKNFPNLTGSDLQEEVFVKIMEDLFNNIVASKYDPSRVFTSKGELINAINSLFESEIPTDTDILDLMQTPTDQILFQFMSKLFNYDGEIQAQTVYRSQKLNTTKHKYIKNGLIEENCE